MFDLGWSEILLIGIVTLVALGPKELPQAMRMVGKVLRKVRSLSSEVHKQMDDLMRETELQELRDQARIISPSTLQAQARNLLDPEGTVQNSLGGMPPSPGAAPVSPLPPVARPAATPVATPAAPAPTPAAAPAEGGLPPIRPGGTPPQS